MLWLWSGPPDSYYWFYFVSVFQLFLAVEFSSLFHLYIRLIFMGFFLWCCTDELGTLHADWTNVLCIPRHNSARVVATYNRFYAPPPPNPNPSSPSNIFTVRSKAVLLLLCFTISVIVYLCMYILVKFLFWIAVWKYFWEETVELAFCL